jgi:hypothetical protein
MPAIIEKGTSQLGRAAAGAAQAFFQHQQRQDRLNSEAADRAYADELLQFRKQQADRSYGLQQNADQRAQQQLEQRGAIFERDLAQQDADAGFYRGLAIEHGADPAELEGMSAEGVRQAANVMMHRQRVQQRAQSTERFASDVFAMLGIEAPMQQGEAAPGQGMGIEQPGAGVQAAPADPFAATIATMMQNATTEEDFEQVEAMLTRAMQTSHQARQDAEERMQAAPLYQGMVARYVGALPNDDASELATAYSLWEMGRLSDTQLTKAINMAAERVEKFKQGGTSRPDPIMQARIDSIVRDSMLSADEKDAKLRALQGGRAPASIEPEAEPERTRLSFRKVKKLIGSQNAESLLRDLPKVPEDQREDFALRRLSRIALEEDLSEEQVLDLAESFLDNIN